MTDEELIEAMALQMERRKHGLRFEVASDSMLACARAAFEVAEPVIREQVSNALREQIRLLTEDMPAGDARRMLAEQHAEIERLRLAAGQ